MTVLRILLPNYADFESALEEEARLFEEAHPGVAVELTTVSIHELHQAAIAGGGLREGRYDLALLVSDWLAEGVATASLEDMNPWLRRRPIPEWPEGWASSLVAPLFFGDHLSALPWHDGPECLVYRSDLFADPASRIAYASQFGRELAPPTTWEDFEQIARFFTNPAKSIYGTVFAAFPDGHNTMYDFALQTWSRGGELLDAAGRPCITTPEATQALDYYRRIVRDPEGGNPGSHEIVDSHSGDLVV